MSQRESNIENVLEVALKLTKEAGEMIREAVFLEKKVSTKSEAIDFVTETDVKVEKFLFSGLAQEFPSHKFIGEESTSQCIKLTDDPTWIIDPIDGTMNFVHGNPLVCISIGYYVNQVAEIGIIYNPVLNELYTAVKGEGAKLNDRPLKVSGVKELSKALVCLEGGCTRDTDRMHCVMENFSILYPRIQGIRSYGTAAISMAILATGGVDAYFESGPHIWDMAAGSLIIREAGGVVIDPKGGPLDLMSRQFLCASSQELASEISKLIKLPKLKRDDE